MNSFFKENTHRKRRKKRGILPCTGVFACLALFISFSLISCNNENTGKPGRKKVEIKKENGVYRIYKNGEPILVKGAVGHTHISELAASGGNTICIWDTTLMEQTLNDAVKYNVSVIAGLDIPSGELTAWYKDEAKVNKMFGAYERIVNKYKSHPALLAWGLATN